MLEDAVPVPNTANLRDPIWEGVTFFITVVVILYYILILPRKHPKRQLKNVHCMITGGSSGIGLALATKVVKYGGNVTIIARSKERLASAKELIMAEAKNQDQKVLTFSADISESEDLLKDIVEKAEEQLGPVGWLINCAGTSVCHPFMETPVEDFSKMFHVNYIGSVYMTRAVLPSMQKRQGGNIVFVSSVAGLMGLYGYTAYSASKFALRGLAESLQMEIKPYKINITVAFPPDTDTPGFAEEMKNKPIETVKISESAGLYTADKVALKILLDTIDKKFMSTVGFDGHILATMCGGMSPIRHFFDMLFQVSFVGIFRLASIFILFKFDKIIKKCAKEKESHSKKEKSKTETVETE